MHNSLDQRKFKIKQPIISIEVYEFSRFNTEPRDYSQ